MIAWRISSPDRVTLDGEEARAKGGRWHEPGRPMVYAASSCALATLEFLAHLEDDSPEPLVAMRIAVPDDLRIDEHTTDMLPDDWRAPDHPTCRELGQQWLETPVDSRAAVLRVPSAVVPLESNYVIDPSHPDFERIELHEAVDYTLDDRVV